MHECVRRDFVAYVEALCMRQSLHFEQNGISDRGDTGVPA